MNKIWDFAPHNAFTDLIRYQNRWICCFREATEHAHKSFGTICLIESIEGREWRLFSRLHFPSLDLRDPKLSLSPDGSLLLLFAAVRYFEDESIDTVVSCTTHTTDGTAWSTWTEILPNGFWLWDLTWYEKKGYGLAYQPKQKERGNITLWETSCGNCFEKIATFTFPNSPSEGTIAFTEDRQAIAVLRCDDRKNRKAQIGKSLPSFREWTWRQSSLHFGCPSLLSLPSKKIIGAGRLLQSNPYGLFAATALADIDEEITPFRTLVSGGDCGYPGTVLHEDKLWISYYSSHEGKTNLYFSVILSR